MRDDIGRLHDILEALEKIQSRAQVTQQEFEADEMLQVWVLHYLLLIGEAVSRLSTELIEQYPQVPWKKIIGIRNILVHQYFEVDLEIVWDTVANELQPFHKQIKSIIKKLMNS